MPEYVAAKLPLPAPLVPTPPKGFPAASKMVSSSVSPRLILPVPVIPLTVTVRVVALVFATVNEVKPTEASFKTVKSAPFTSIPASGVFASVNVTKKSTDVATIPWVVPIPFNGELAEMVATTGGVLSTMNERRAPVTAVFVLPAKSAAAIDTLLVKLPAGTAQM